MVLWLGMADQSVGADVSGYVVATTDYVYRGVSYSNSDPALQLGGDIAFANGIFLGAWGSTIDISSGAGRQRDFEMKYYLGYGREIDRNWTLTGNAVLFTYPGTEGDFDYDYEEYSLAVNYRDSYWLEYSMSPDFYNTDRATWNVAFLAEWPLPQNFRLSAGIGHNDVSELTGSTYRYWQFGVSRSVNLFDFDLRYHGTSDWIAMFSNAERTDDRIVFSVRLQF